MTTGDYIFYTQRVFEMGHTKQIEVINQMTSSLFACFNPASQQHPLAANDTISGCHVNATPTLTSIPRIQTLICQLKADAFIPVEMYF